MFNVGSLSLSARNTAHSSPWVTEEDIACVVRALRSGMLAKGELVAEFELQCSVYLGFTRTFATGSGQSALERALRALGIQSGSQVVMPSYVCRAVADSIRSVGAVPVFCDVGDDWCVTPEAVARALSDKTAALIVVHPFGIIAKVEPLKRFGLPIIEDCCQCFSPDVGHVGDLSVYSFHATKCLTTGEGGMLTASDPHVAEQIAASFEIHPDTSRLSDLQAALGISQLARYDRVLQIRKEMANRYFEVLPSDSTDRLRHVADRSIFFRFPLSLDKGFDAFAEHFARRKIQVRQGVDTLLHREAGLPDHLFPTTVNLFHTTLSLPFYPSLSDPEMQHVLAVATDILQ